MGFKIGEIVRFKDGDGRPHRIVNIVPHGPLNSKEHTLYQFGRADGVRGFDNEMKYYEGDYIK